MIVAVSYDVKTGEVFQHFGQTEYFKLYTIENDQVIKTEVLGSEEFMHESLAAFLKSHGAGTLICGGMGAGARMALMAHDIWVYGGVNGHADAAVQALLEGRLIFSPAAVCAGHDEEEHHGNCGTGGGGCCCH